MIITFYVQVLQELNVVLLIVSLTFTPLALILVNRRAWGSCSLLFPSLLSWEHKGLA
jgi:hypothetical protein